MLFYFNLFELLEFKIRPRRWLSKASPLTARKPAAALIKTRPWQEQHSLHSGKNIRPPAFLGSLGNQKCGIDQAQALPTANHVGPRAVLGLGMGARAHRACRSARRADGNTAPAIAICSAGDPLQNSLPWSACGLGRSAALSSSAIAGALRPSPAGPKSKVFAAARRGLGQPCFFEGAGGVSQRLGPPPDEGTWQSTFASAKRPPAVAACAQFFTSAFASGSRSFSHTKERKKGPQLRTLSSHRISVVH